MSSFKSRLLRGGLLAGTSVLAAGAIASPAIGAGTAIRGVGASLQNAAQAAWVDPAGSGSWPAAANFLPGASASYAGTSSGDGLRAFGNTGAGLASPLPEYIGTDDPPTAAQNANALAASGSRQITIPVAQAPIAVIVSVPSSISGAAGQRLRVTNRLLEETFQGNTATWGDFLTGAGLTGLSGAGLSSRIELQVRGSVSGTTYGFKNYLAKVDATGWGAYDNGDVSWPSAVTTANCSVTQTSGGQLTRAVAGDSDGSIAYANLADAVSAGNGGFTSTLTATTFAGPCGASSSHAIAYALVQNNGTSTSPTFADPINNGRANTNPNRTWTVPGGGSLPGTYDSWFGVSANDPNAGSSGVPAVQRYGVLAATYDVAWDDYSTATLRSAYGANWADKRDSVKNYLQYVVSDSSLFATDGGQLLLARTTTPARYYAPLPTAVRTAAQTAAAAIG